jgi:hypothetical protein
MRQSVRSVRNAVLVVAIVGAAAVTFACLGPLRPITVRRVAGVLLHRPTERDRFFNLVAVDFGQPDLCDRIDWRADGSTGGFQAQLRTMRSACRSNRNPMPITDSMTSFVAQMRALGYTDADVAQAAYAENHELTPVYGVYLERMADDEFRARVRTGASYAEPRDRARVRPAKPVEFLYQMVAIDAPEATLCSKVSPNATFDQAGGAIGLLQSRCYLHVAFNTRDARLCDPLPAAGSFPHINESYDSREKCRETVGLYSRRDVHDTRRYGSTPFPRAADFPAILREIGYRDDTLPAVPAPTDSDYREFVLRLIRSGPPSERAEFLRRVEALQ